MLKPFGVTTVILAPCDNTASSIPLSLKKYLNETAAGNPKYIIEMIESCLSPHAIYDDSGPAIKIHPTGRIQV